MGRPSVSKLVPFREYYSRNFANNAHDVALARVPVKQRFPTNQKPVRPGVSKLTPFCPYYSRNFLHTKHTTALACFPSQWQEQAIAKKNGCDLAGVQPERRPGHSHTDGED